MEQRVLRVSGFRGLLTAPRELRRQPAQASRALAVDHHDGRLLLARLADTRRRRAFVIGAASELRNGNGTGAITSEIAEGEVYERLRRESPDEVHFMLGGALDDARVVAIGSRLLMDGVAVHFVLPELAGLPLHTRLVRRGSRLAICLSALRDHWLGRAARRLVDVAGSLLLLILLAPVLVAVAGVVWRRLGRPIVFVQERIGRGGRLFRLYKFRSMVADAESILKASPEIYRRYVASNYKLPEDEDPRVTPLGRFLRRTSLDELPQLWNVLRGDMSFVGPRPIVPEEIAEYGDYARLLLRVKPGLTGLWQVSGRSRVGYPERARIDLRYVGQRSLGRDLQILLRTVPVVASRRGAL
jgi:lipopolysaccharide/colanic/teichoic acid biosynthesis glycosyltransferase